VLFKNKRIAIAAVGAVVVVALIGGTAYALHAANSKVVDSAQAAREKRIIRDFDIKVSGNISGCTVIDPGSLVIISDKSAETTASIEPQQAKRFEGKDFKVGNYSVYQVENPVLSDGSLLVLSQSVPFSLETTPASSKETTQIVEVRLTKIEVASMTQQQLCYASEKIRAAGNAKLADTLAGRILSAPIGNTDDGSAKPGNWENSDLNPHRGKVWRAAVTEEVKVVTRQAWSETVMVGGTNVTTLYCSCGAGPFASDAEWQSHQWANTTIIHDEKTDTYAAKTNGHAWAPRTTLVGATPQQVDHPEEFYIKTQIITPAGWYAKR